MPDDHRTVHIEPYNENWPMLFSDLAKNLRGTLGDAALRIDHVGSTSIPGMAAKPIIDIQISVASFEPAKAYATPLQRLGFVFRKDNPELTKRYFREPIGERETHIHVRRAGSFSEQFNLLFRDYMRVQPAAAAEYAELKLRLATQHSTDRAAYTEAKSTFIWRTMALADRWAQETGWVPGASDA